MVKKKKTPPAAMTMKPKDVDYRWRLLDRWGKNCIICGLPFETLACVTKEHIVPKSLLEPLVGGKPRKPGNVAPSHHRCNALRGADSVEQGRSRVDEMRRTMTASDFISWLNAPVPFRTVPAEAKRPLRGFCELPEYLPGMEPNTYLHENQARNAAPNPQRGDCSAG